MSFPDNQWTVTQCAFVATKLFNLSGLPSTASDKRRHVQESWMACALDPNNDDFNLQGIPSESDIQHFSERTAQQRERGQIAYAVDQDSNPIRSSVQQKAPKRQPVYHSNDAKRSDRHYLTFPLTDAKGISNRVMWAYSMALGIKGNKKKRRSKLEQMVRDANSAGIQRPELGPDGKDWKDCFFTVKL